MLPMLRLIPVGGVFLAIVILVLALNPPGGSRTQLPQISARGALIERYAHPEWRQFLMLAATRRADELNRLRDLPDKLVRHGPDVAGLPADRSAAEPDDETGSINGPAGPNLPVDIGERSSTELPVGTQEEKPPVIRTPRRVRRHNESLRPGLPGVRQTLTATLPSVGQTDPVIIPSPDANQARAGTGTPD